jgi:hypothetical protein
VRSGRGWRVGWIEQAGRLGGRSWRTGRTRNTAGGVDVKDEQVNEGGHVGEKASKVGEMAEVHDAGEQLSDVSKAGEMGKE